MGRFARVQEEGGRACRREGGGDLAADMTRLADAGHDDATLRGQDRIHGLDEGLIDCRRQFHETLRLLEDSGAPRIQRGGGLVLGSHNAIRKGRHLVLKLH